MDNLNTGLIDAMKSYLPKGDNLANTLMNILYLGKEATYRRLRGEVPFTFTEVATISQSMGISLDKIVGAKLNNNAIFNLNLLKNQHPMDNYCNMIDSYIALFSELVEQEGAELCTSSNVIPPNLYLKYESLSKFRFFKWMYQHEKRFMTRHYEDMEMPDNLIYRQKKFVYLSQLFPMTTYIWDKEMFARLVKEMKFFLSIELISAESLKKLKEELLLLLDEFEKISALGQFETGKEVKIYISNVSFESNYSYMESNDYHQSLIEVFAINSITSYDDLLFENLKEWIQSLKKYSILISQSGEVQRKQFFKRQRDVVRRL